MRIPYGDGELELKVNIRTAVIYEQQFESDIVKDVLGVMDFSDRGAGEFKVDFTKTNWTALMKGVWAAARTADPKFPAFEVFEREHEELNLLHARDGLGEAIIEAFFSATPRQPGEGAGTAT